MKLIDIANYLAATAAADGPICGREKDLMRHLLKDFGADSQSAEKIVAELSGVVPNSALKTPRDASVAVKLLRGLLVISYSDGSFEKEELPYLRHLVDSFNIQAQQLNTLKLQAHYYLGQDPPSISIPTELLTEENWEGACGFAHERYELFRTDFYRKVKDDLLTADTETCYIAMSVGPPTFDTEHTRDRFLQSNPSFADLEPEQSLTFLRS